MSESSGLAGIVQSYLDLLWSLDPVAATAAGVPEHDHRLGAHGEEDVRRYVAALKSIGNSLEGAAVESLADEVDRTALLGAVRFAVHRYEHETPHVRNPTFWISQVFDGLNLLLTSRDRPPEHVASALERRLRAVPAYLATARETLQECPRVFVETAMDVTAAGRVLVDEAARRIGSVPDDDLGEVQDAARTAIDAFGDHLRDTLLGDASDGFAIGEDGFNFRLHYQHALRNSAPELWRYGHALVETAEADVAKVAREIDGSAPWQDVVRRLRDDHPEAEELVGAYAERVDRARRFVEERGLMTIPEGPLEVVETPGFLRPLIPFAAYQPPGVFAADRTGRFYVTVPAADLDSPARHRLLRDHCLHELASTALHEGFPGHHLQFLAAHELTRPVRQIVGTPVAVEGWALYCEEMMGEEGFYSTPEERLFQRVSFLFRACRVIADVGLHTRGMSIEDATRLLTDRVGFERPLAEAEVRRYCAEPTYQLSYAVGRREFLSLREAYRAAHGSAYSLRRLHDALLEFGGLPVSLMRWGMNLDE